MYYNAPTTTNPPVDATDTAFKITVARLGLRSYCLLVFNEAILFGSVFYPRFQLRARLIIFVTLKGILAEKNVKGAAFRSKLSCMLIFS